MSTLARKSVFLILGLEGTHILLSMIELKGSYLDQVKLKVPYQWSREGHVEFNPHDLVSLIKTGINHLIQKHQVALHAIGIVSTGFSAMAWHKDTGATLGYAVGNIKNAEGIRHVQRSVLQDSIAKISGLYQWESATFLAWDWLIRNIPEVQLAKKNKTLLLGTMESWLLFNLSGKNAFKTDITHALRTGLFNMAEQAWDKFLIREFGIETWMLPQVHASSFHYAVTKGFMPLPDGIEIGAISFQSQAELLGNFGSQYGQCQLSWFDQKMELLVNTGEVQGAKGQTCTLLSSDRMTRYGLVQPIHLPIWPKKILGDMPDLPVSGQLQHHNVYMRRREERGAKPTWDWISLTEDIEVQDLYFSYHKSIAFFIKEHLFHLEKQLGFYFKELLVDPHISVELLQLYSDICELPFVLVRQQSCSAWGAWVLLCLRNESLKLNLISKYRIYKRVLPSLDPISTVALYQEWRDKIR